MQCRRQVHPARLSRFWSRAPNSSGDKTMVTRRSILKTSLAAGALSIWDASIRMAFANAPTDRRFVVVILRGALDGLAAVPPYGDPDYASARGKLALPMSGAGAPTDLDGMFGLHPSLATMAKLWSDKQL